MAAAVSHSMHSIVSRILFSFLRHRASSFNQTAIYTNGFPFVAPINVSWLPLPFCMLWLCSSACVSRNIVFLTPRRSGCGLHSVSAFRDHCFNTPYVARALHAEHARTVPQWDRVAMRPVGEPRWHLERTNRSKADVPTSVCARKSFFFFTMENIQTKRFLFSVRRCIIWRRMSASRRWRVVRPACIK